MLGKKHIMKLNFFSSKILIEVWHPIVKYFQGALSLSMPHQHRVARAGSNQDAKRNLITFPAYQL